MVVSSLVLKRIVVSLDLESAEMAGTDTTLDPGLDLGVEFMLQTVVTIA